MNSNYLYYYPLAGASSMTFKDIDSYFSEETKAFALTIPDMVKEFGKPEHNPWRN